jgi:formylglycine-generating enzyme required for sulfatase activity
MFRPRGNTRPYLWERAIACLIVLMYRAAARGHATPDAALNNLGFCCVRDSQ